MKHCAQPSNTRGPGKAEKFWRIPYMIILLGPDILVRALAWICNPAKNNLALHVCILILGDKKYWVLPNTVRAEGETMREAAERALRAHCGPHLPFSVLGHAPLTFYKYKYPRRYRESSQRQGAKAGLRIRMDSLYADPVPDPSFLKVIYPSFSKNIFIWFRFFWLRITFSR
jgi:hypothetical protein